MRDEVFRSTTLLRVAKKVAEVFRPPKNGVHQLVEFDLEADAGGKNGRLKPSATIANVIASLAAGGRSNPFTLGETDCFVVQMDSSQ